MQQRGTRFIPGLLLLIVVLLSTTPVLAKNLYVLMIANDAGAAYLTSQFIPEFEKRHGVKVDLERVSWTARPQKLLVTTAAGNPPDVFMSGAEHIYDLVSQNMIEPIDKWLNAMPDKNDFFPPALGSSTWKGHSYGLPVYTAPRVFWYRADLFAEAGLDPVKPPATWNELLVAAKRLTRTDGTKVVRQGYDLERWTGTNYSSNIQEFILFLMQNGGRMFNPDTFQAEFNKQEGIETMEFMLKLRDTVRPPGYTIDAGSGPGNRLFRGVSAIRLESSNAVRDFYNPALDLTRADNMRAMAPPPGQKQRTSLVFSDWLGIHSQSTQKELAWAFIKEFMSANTLRDYNMAAGYQSPRRSTARDFIREQPMVNWVYETLNYSIPYPIFPNVDDAGKTFNERYMAMINGKESVQAGLSEGARLWDLVMKK